MAYEPENEDSMARWAMPTLDKRTGLPKEVTRYGHRVGDYGVRKAGLRWEVDHIPTREVMAVEMTESEALTFARGMERVAAERVPGRVIATLVACVAVGLLVWAAVRWSYELSLGSW